MCVSKSKQQRDCPRDPISFKSILDQHDTAQKIVLSITPLQSLFIFHFILRLHIFLKLERIPLQSFEVWKSLARAFFNLLSRSLSRLTFLISFLPSPQLFFRVIQCNVQRKKVLCKYLGTCR